MTTDEALHRVVIPHTRSLAAAFGAVVAALGVAVFTALLVVDPVVPSGARVAVGAVGGLFAAGLLTIGLRLLAARGGLYVDNAGDRIGVGVTSPGDTWWIPRAEVAGVRIVPTPAPDGQSIEHWTATLVAADRPPIILFSSQDRTTVILIARRVSERAGLEPPETVPAPAPSAATPAHERFAVDRGAALSGVLVFFGVSLLAVGVTMLTQVAREPVFGFLFGPLLMFLGLALFGVSVVKRLAHEELICDGLNYTHRFAWGRFTWAERKVRAPRPGWRLYVHGLRGAHLELVGEDGVLVIASGTTTRSRASVQEVARIPGRFTRPLDAEERAREEEVPDDVSS